MGESTREQAKRLYLEGHEVAYICQFTDIHRSTLYRWLDEDGIKRTRRTFWTIEQIRRTIQNKKNQIADLEKELDRIVRLNSGGDDDA